jgi:hypothetical protein
MSTVTAVVASMSAEVGGNSRSGEIFEEGARYVVLLEGRRIGPSGSLSAAAHRSASALRSEFPYNPSRWRVSASCQKNGIAVSIVHPSSAGGGRPHPCVEDALGGRQFRNFNEAPQAGA